MFLERTTQPKNLECTYVNKTFLLFLVNKITLLVILSGSSSISCPLDISLGSGCTNPRSFNQIHSKEGIF
jgi:hypothetical protein